MRIFRLALAGAGLCGLSACASGLSGACALKPAGVIHTIDHGSYASVPAEIDGHRIDMMLDTGFTESSVKPADADALQLPVDPHRISAGTDFSGTSSSHDRIARSFAIDDITLPVRSLQVSDGGKGATKGVVGLDAFAGYDLLLDLHANRISLFVPTGCAPPSQSGEVTFRPPEVDFSARNRLFLSTTVDGHSLRTLVDSGAGLDAITADAAEQKLGVAHDQLQREVDDTGRGADGASVQVGHHVFGLWRIGPWSARSRSVAVIFGAAQDFDAVLGYGFLRGQAMWISASSQEVRFLGTHPAAP